MKKHKWWHFIFGREYKSETVYEDKNIHTSNYWYSCKKCGERLTEKQGCTTFSISLGRIRIK